MQLLARNVNNAFGGIVRGIADGMIATVRTTSRVGDVLQVVEPAMVTYERPRERVLFNPVRDANPFFHLFESLWMLAGHNDVAPLAFYSSKIKDISSDDGRTFNGAYGYRWRKAQTPGDGMYDPTVVTDQIQTLIDHLRNKPDSRRAVLQMWNVEDDLLKIDVTKDVCCNTCVYFLIRTEFNSEMDGKRFKTRQEAASWADELGWDRVKDIRRTDRIADNGSYYLYREGVPTPYLDMTVCNRSNDAILGMLGANVVHFSFLQEYMANCLGVQVGKYHQFTNNLHVYTSNFKPDEWLPAHTCMELYTYGDVEPGVQLVKDQATFDYECAMFVKNHHASHMHAYADPGYTEPFLRDVAWPMCMAWLANKKGRKEVALNEWVPRILASDWNLAAKEWIERRIAAKESKDVSDVS